MNMTIKQLSRYMVTISVTAFLILIIFAAPLNTENTQLTSSSDRNIRFIGYMINISYLVFATFLYPSLPTSIQCKIEKVFFQ